MIVGVSVVHVIAEIGPHLLMRRRRSQHAHQIEQQAISNGQGIARTHRRLRAAIILHPQQVPRRIAELLFNRLVRNITAELPIFIHRARDNADMQLLGALGIGVDVMAKAFLAAIGQPFLNRQAIALRLGNLLAVGVEEQLVNQPFRLAPTKHLGDAARLDAGIGQILAVHFIVDAQRDPAHGEIDLPLQFGHAAQRALFNHAAVFIGEAHDASVGIDHFHRHLQHHACRRADRHDRRIGRRALGPQSGQHNVEDRLIVAQHVPQRIIERARIVAIAGGNKFVIETEAIEEVAQHRIVVMGKALKLLERVRNAAERLAEVLGQHCLIGHIVRDLAQPIHVIAEGNQPRRRRRAVFARGDDLIRLAHQRRAQHFLKRPDMRQAAGAVARFKQHSFAASLSVAKTFGQPLGLLKRPSLGVASGCDEIGAEHSGELLRKHARFASAKDGRALPPVTRGS